MVLYEHANCRNRPQIPETEQRSYMAAGLNIQRKKVPYIGLFVLEPMSAVCLKSSKLCKFL